MQPLFYDVLSFFIIFIVILFTGFNSFKFNRVINVDYQNEINIKYHLYDDNNQHTMINPLIPPSA